MDGDNYDKWYRTGTRGRKAGTVGKGSRQTQQVRCRNGVWALTKQAFCRVGPGGCFIKKKIRGETNDA